MSAYDTRDAALGLFDDLMPILEAKKDTSPALDDAWRCLCELQPTLEASPQQGAYEWAQHQGDAMMAACKTILPWLRFAALDDAELFPYVEMVARWVPETRILSGADWAQVPIGRQPATSPHCGW